MGGVDDDNSLHDEGLQEFSRPDDDDWSVIQTAVGHLKKRSFPADFNGMIPRRKYGAVFQTNDDDIGHKGRKLGAGGRTPPSV